MCLGNTSKDWSIDNMKKAMFMISVDYDAIAVSDTLDIHKYSMKKMEQYKNVWICKANICFSNDVF